MHFFDMFAGWLGAGEVVAAQASRRHGTKIEDQVQCTVRYGDGVHVNFYHGFQQPGRMDRQELRLVFERGDVLLHGWVPTYARIHAIADESDTRELCELFRGARIDALAAYGPKDRHCCGAWTRVRRVSTVRFALGRRAREIADCIANCCEASWPTRSAWIRDRSHVRKTTEQNGRDSVAMACAADRLAHAICN